MSPPVLLLDLEPVGVYGVPGRTRRHSFAGGEGGSFSLSLVFDTTSTGTAVTAHSNKLLKLMEVDTSLPGYDASRNNGRPPWVKFHWGTHLHSFKAVVKSADVTFTYFSNEGLPLRLCEMRLEQFEPDANWGRRNPTSATRKPNRTHQFSGRHVDRIASGTTATRRGGATSPR